MKNILNKFTIRSLKLNKKRTIATCIGIILSTALICAVAGVFSSFQQTLIAKTIKDNGDYHAIFYAIPKDEQKYILENRNIESYGIMQGIGYSKLEGSINEYKPYIYLMEFDKMAQNNLGLTLLEGRMPENETELVISKHIEDNGGIKYKVGDKLILEIGKRISGKDELDQYNPYNNSKDAGEPGYLEEKLETTETREFTIVGVIERPSNDIENYSAPGYTVITTLKEIKDNANIIVKFTNMHNTYDYIKDIAEDKTQPFSDPDRWVSKYTYDANSELLRWSGVMRSNDTMIMFYSLAGIVIGIIIVSSVFVIRNSFAISITEKMKQYGMLSSIGATKKQIKNNVLFEGMILGVISIPIGILCGILATFILIQISTALVGKIVFADEIKFVFDMPIIVIILSALLGFVTIYLSCIFSAKKAAKISPIDAIRSNEDIKIKAKKVKSPKIIKKIFGVGGDIAYKNLKRNKKKYRTTVISLVVSITVFISLTTFMNYAFDMTGIYYKEMDYNISLSAYYPTPSLENQEKTYEYYKDIAKKHNLKKYTIKRNINVETNLTDKILKEYQHRFGGEITIPIEAIGEKAYKEYLKQIKGKYEDCKDGIIYYNNSMVYEYNDKVEKVQPLTMKVSDKITGKLQETGEEISLEIVKITDKAPMAVNTSYYANHFGCFIISDEMMDKIGNYNCYSMKINSDDAFDLCEKIKKEKNELVTATHEEFTLHLTNYQEKADEEKRMVLLISIFLYGFITVISLIGVTNIFNTITTNMNLRSKEFAMLKSIGMTKKEFNKMIRLESIFYGVKSLIIGIALGLGISYWMYKVVIGAEATSGLPFIFPTGPIVISIIFISIIIGIIMKYSLNKINKQNIIETIRKDNI